MTITFEEGAAKPEREEVRQDLSQIPTPTTVLRIVHLPERNEVWAGTRDGTILVFDDRTHERKTQIIAHENEVLLSLLVLRRESLRVVSCASDNMIKVIAAFPSADADRAGVGPQHWSYSEATGA